MTLALIPPNVIDYKVVQGKNLEEFEALMLTFLAQGFIPYGELNIQRACAHEEFHPLYSQVVIRQGLPKTETLNIIAKMIKSHNDTGMKVDQNIANIISQFAARSQR